MRNVLQRQNGACFAMPDMAAQMKPGDFSDLETVASMYGASAFAGYLLIVLPALLMAAGKLSAFRLLHKEP